MKRPRVSRLPATCTSIPDAHLVLVPCDLFGRLAMALNRALRASAFPLALLRHRLSGLAQALDIRNSVDENQKSKIS